MTKKRTENPPTKNERNGSRKPPKPASNVLRKGNCFGDVTKYDLWKYRLNFKLMQNLWVCFRNLGSAGVNVCVHTSCARDCQCDMNLRILDAKFTCLFTAVDKYQLAFARKIQLKLYSRQPKQLWNIWKMEKLQLAKEFWLFSLQINRYPNTHLMQFFLFEFDKITRHRSLMEIQV